MKKIRLLIMTGLLYGQVITAQTLTALSNQPVAGDVHSIIGYDSTTVIPKNTGLNQQWDFSSLIQNTVGITSTTFVAASSIPSASLFAGATLAEDYGTGYDFYKATAGQLENLGYYEPVSPPTSVSYTNSALVLTWPMAYATTFTDTYSGTQSGFISGNPAGSVSVTATGVGTLIFGGQTYPGVLQVKTVRNLNGAYSMPSPPFSATATALGIQYDYYGPGKFPLVTVIYETAVFNGTTETFVTISLNKTMGCSSPTLHVVQSNSISCAGQSTTLTATGADSYSWFGFFPISSGVLVANPAIATTYTVIGKNNNCDQTSTLTVTQAVGYCIGLKNETLTNDMINAYPNPFEDELSISNNSAFETKLSVFNMVGSCVYNITINAGETKTVNTQNLESGVYILTMNTNATQLNKKLIKK